MHVKYLVMYSISQGYRLSFQIRNFVTLCIYKLYLISFMFILLVWFTFDVCQIRVQFGLVVLLGGFMLISCNQSEVRLLATDCVAYFGGEQQSNFSSKCL